jgi:hypothetical protein
LEDAAVRKEKWSGADAVALIRKRFFTPKLRQGFKNSDRLGPERAPERHGRDVAHGLRSLKAGQNSDRGGCTFLACDQLQKRGERSQATSTSRLTYLLEQLTSNSGHDAHTHSSQVPCVTNSDH